MSKSNLSKRYSNEFQNQEKEKNVFKKIKLYSFDQMKDLETNIEPLYSTLKQFSYSRYQFSNFISILDVENEE
ncbi:hypothetical protein QI290_12560 [Staphylococcus saprophyticus]|nr:hypothetical protein [Staphylococcus saprophyticus]MDW3920840.1 hypothetical protein [Staphylococcus saprophyticus]MDW3948348.1 hypothetical protein [Staphylococcus saprophyticus]MDW3953359.1 hypothetical protein [Staphylococcus saprophyticus]